MNNRTIPQTSTFTIHHDRCDPDKWTFKDIMAFEDFIKTGNMECAKHLAELGVELVVSDHHIASGGNVEQLGWTNGLDQPTFTEIDEAVENAGGRDVTALIPIYRGQTVYFAKIDYADGPGGDYSHTEYEPFMTQQAADRRMIDLLAS